MTSREKFAAYGAWAAVCFLWGTTYLAIRIGLETLPPMLFAGLRFLTAGTMLFTFVFFMRGARLPQGREWFVQSVVGLMLLGVGNGGVVLAEQWVPSGPAALLVATSPFWVMGLERVLRNGERVSGRALVGLMIGFGGLVLLVAPNLFGARLDGYYLLGALLIQLGCASWSTGSVYSKHHQTKLSPLMAAAVQMLIAGAALTLVGTTLGEWRVIHFSGRSFSAFAYLVVFGSIVAYGSYTYAVQKLPLSLVSMYSYVNPVIAVLLGWAILSESLGWRVIGATTIILAGVALVKTAPKRSVESAPRTPEREAEPRTQTLAHASKACSVGTN
ncbi:MAG: EamA family transporter [Acidobacteria bacterium]|nr:EamA family transporter [Acidobacteriota bacterium]